MKSTIKNIIFDFGGVLINWDPAHLYRKIFSSEEKVNWFLNEICTSEWNEQQDAGRLLSEATQIKVAEFPDYQKEIEAYYGRWEEMLVGPIHENVQILEQFHNDGIYRLFGLTNWSGETFPIALGKYEFLQYFEDILVSGDEGLKKPDHRIYQKLVNRNRLVMNESLFLDDNMRNVIAARKVGLHAIHYESANQLLHSFSEYGILT